MSSSEIELIKKLSGPAKTARHNAYAPYSGFAVGAAALLDNGEVYAGSNIENASFGATVCAERVAIWKGISAGGRRVEAVLIFTDTPEPCPPCALCRQVFTEFADAKTPVIAVANKDNFKSYTVERLSPFPFTGGWF